MKDLFYKGMATFHRKHGLRQLQLLEKKLVSPRARFAVPFAYRGKGHFKSIEPRQNSWEIERLYKTVCDLAPHRVLEIGTARGGTLYLWLQAATEQATVVSVDLPGGEFGGAYPASRIPFYEAFARPSQKLYLVRKDSHKAKTVKEVCDLYDGHPVDFAFIDGDHSYEGVKSDFFNYGPLVRCGGIIAFHDILPRSDLPEIQVDRFWREIRNEYDTQELIGPEGSGRKIGIGIVRIDKRGIRKQLK